MPPETVNLILATKDRKVPTAKQFELRAALNNPDARILKHPHVSTVVRSLIWGKGRDRVLQFFNDRLSLDNPRIPTTTQFLQELDVVAKH